MAFFGLLKALITDADAVDVRADASTHTLQVIDYPHHEIHGGSGFFVCNSTPDIGAQTTPADVLSLTFTTPDTTKWAHMLFEFLGGPGALCGIREAGTGGASPTGAIVCANRNRNSGTTSVLSDLNPTAGQISYDATLDTGGTAFEFYLPGSGGTPAAGSPGTMGGGRAELILKQNTRYQVYMQDTANVAASIILDWYEHTDKS